MRTVMVILCVAGIMLLTSIAAAQDESLPDTLSIGKAVAIKAGQYAVQVNFVNDQNLAAVTIPLIIRGKGATIDSVSFVDSRVAYLSMRPITIAEDRQRVIFGAIQFTESEIPPGKGLLATIYVTLTDLAENGSVEIDTATFGTTSLLFTLPSSESFVPQFIPGPITVSSKEANSDVQIKTITDPGALQLVTPIRVDTSNVKAVTADDNIPKPDSHIVVEETPVQIYEEAPVYPPKAKEAGYTGKVVVEAFVDVTGTVKKASAKSCTHPGEGFEEAAVAAAYKCQYKPAISKGKPIGAWVT